jgi:hypothetical protein
MEKTFPAAPSGRPTGGRGDVFSTVFVFFRGASPESFFVAFFPCPRRPPVVFVWFFRFFLSGQISSGPDRDRPDIRLACGFLWFGSQNTA